MKGYDLYVTIVCAVIFSLLTVTFALLITLIGKQQIKLVRSGIEDENIKTSVLKKLNKNKKRCTYGVFDVIVSSVICILLTVICAVTVFTGTRGNNVIKGSPALKVVASTSMSVKYERNLYLFNHGLDNQLQMFDLIVLHELPPEDEIQLYDIIVYEHINGSLYIHRVVRIEEPNDEHPNERYFLFQGDANSYADVYPVRYSQMKSIYRNERMANVGSFVFFMQSPAGILCVLLIVAVLIIMPIIDNMFVKLELERVRHMVDMKVLNASALEIYSKTKKKSPKRKGDT